MEHDERAARPAHQRDPGAAPTRDGSVAGWLASASGRRIVVESDPALTWAAHNVVATVDDPRVARHIIRDWERIDKADREASDRRVGFMILAPPGPGASVDDADDDRAIARHALGRGLSGFVPGMLIGAVVVGVAAWLVVGSLAAALAGAGRGSRVRRTDRGGVRVRRVVRMEQRLPGELRAPTAGCPLRGDVPHR